MKSNLLIQTTQFSLNAVVVSMRNILYRPVYLNMWSPAGGTVGGLDGGRISRAGPEVSQTHPMSSSMSLLV